MISAIAAAPTADNVSGAHDDQQLVQTWIDAQGSSETRRAYAQIGTRFIVALAFEGLCLQALKLRDLQHYLSMIDGAPSTIAKHIAVLKSLLSFAHESGYCATNVGRFVKTPRVRANPQARVIAREDIARMIDACGRDDDRLLVRTFYASGLRLAEMCSLKWQDLRGDVLTVVAGKGNRQRRVRLPASIGGALEARRGHPLSPIFGSARNGGHLTTSGMWRRIKRIGATADVEVSPHRFRHSHGTHAIEAGASIFAVQTTLGHADPRTTTAAYVAPSAAMSSGLALEMP